MSNDLIIDKGFTVLNDFDPADDDKPDPLPRSPFASYADALSVPSPASRAALLDDCAAVFTARTKEDADGYSSGSTYFLPCLMPPRCALEALARAIFRAHVDTLEEMACPAANGEQQGEKKLLYDPERSGAEWWTLVLDTPSDAATASNSDVNSEEEEEDDEVGIHFDADYGLEEQLPNFTLHPRVATITYFSDAGVPTLVLNKRSPSPSDTEKKSLNGHINQAWLSHPRFGKHVAFDGRFLHGGPGEYFPSVARTADDVSEPKAKKRKVEGQSDAPSSKRITFMVNIWLNHCPVESEPLDDDIVANLRTPWEATPEGDPAKGNLKAGDPVTPPFHWNVKDIVRTDTLNNTSVLQRASRGPAGVEECVICNRHVDIAFGASMEAFHNVSKLAAAEGSMPFAMDDGVLTLTVGAEVPSSSDEEDGEDP